MLITVLSLRVGSDWKSSCCVQRGSSLISFFITRTSVSERPLSSANDTLRLTFVGDVGSERDELGDKQLFDGGTFVDDRLVGSFSFCRRCRL